MELTNEQVKFLYNKLEYTFKNSPKGEKIKKCIDNNIGMSLTDDEVKLYSSKFESRFKKSLKPTNVEFRELFQ